MADLISRAAAIECAIDAVDDWDGGWNPNRETVIRKYFEEVPAMDAVPVEWLREFDLYYAGISGGTKYMNELIEAWHKGQGAMA